MAKKMVKYTPVRNIVGNILVENKILKQTLQNSCSGKCQQRRDPRSLNFIPSRSLDRFDQQKSVLTRNIGHISDIYCHAYHLDCHEILFHNEIFVFNMFCKTLTPHQHRA